MAFLSRKQLTVHNQRRAKNHVKLIEKKVLAMVEEISNKDDLPLEWQQMEDLNILNMALHEVLKNEAKIYQKIEL